MPVNLVARAVVYPVMRGELSGDFEQFVLHRSTALLRTAVLLVGDRGHAEDLLQTALLRTAERWRWAHDHPEAYVRRTLVNLAHDRWRRRKRRPEQPLGDTDQPAEPDLAIGVVDRDILRRALAELPRRQREVVVLRFFVDLSVAATASTLRTSEGTVKAHTSRAMARLRRELGATIAEDIHD